MLIPGVKSVLGAAGTKDSPEMCLLCMRSLGRPGWLELSEQGPER